MRSVGAFEAKTHLSRLLDDVAKGETIAITRRGVPVAVLAPPGKVQRPDPEAVVEAMREFRRTHKLALGGLSIRELREEGRR